MPNGNGECFFEYGSFVDLVVFCNIKNFVSLIKCSII